MSLHRNHKRTGFTLVELLTSIAIIVLLIGVLVPALSSARTQARKTTTAGLIKSLDSGCELFRNDFKQYPKSRDRNPFIASDPPLLMGFQWLGLQLAGPDSGGIVDWRDLRNDTNNDKKIDSTDWQEWYQVNTSTSTRKYSRMGPYASVDGDAVQSFRTYINVRSSFGAIPDELNDPSNTDWSNEVMPFFVDSFANPVLYYRANPQTDQAFTTGTSSDLVVGQYDQSDNGYITGCPGADGRYAGEIGTATGWDIAGTGYTGNYVHPLGDFGYNPNSTPPSFVDPANTRTFAYFMHDKKIWDNTENSSGEGRIWPVRPDSYVLISAGPDGVYGNEDDITNFQNTK